MNDHNHNPDQDTHPSDPATDPPEGCGSGPAARGYQTFPEALDAACKDAACMARNAAPKLKGALKGAAHDMAYGAAFGACFAACFAKEMLPEGVKGAFRRGAEAGKKAAASASEAGAGTGDAPALPA